MADNQQKSENDSVAHLFFDGEVLTLTINKEEYSYHAVSGQIGMFQSIPEGQYSIKPLELWYCAWMRPFNPGGFSMTPSGQWNEKRHGLPQPWEKQRVTLRPLSAENNKSGGSYYIFGGLSGGKSCIHLPSQFAEFVADLKCIVAKVNQPEIILTVAYEHQETPIPSATRPAPPIDPPLEPIPKGPMEQSLLNAYRLKGFVPDHVIAEIEASSVKLGITTPLRLAHFLAQCAHESDGFKATKENLNYSKKNLMKNKRFMRSGKSINDYARHPQKIGSLLYASRMGNGDEASGDGYKYRGRGYIQLTGKANYTYFSKFIGDNLILSNPDLVATKYPLASAAFFFNSNHLWSICDRGADEKVVLALTKRVNGGTNGLVDRLKHFKLYYQLLQDV